MNYVILISYKRGENSINIIMCHMQEIQTERTYTRGQNGNSNMNKKVVGLDKIFFEVVFVLDKSVLCRVASI